MKKGISPLIATVLLIAIGVLIAAIVMNWMSSLTKEQTRTIGNKTTESVECIGVVSIDDVYLDFTSSKGRIVVRSSSSASDQILSASMLNKNGVSATNITSFPISISKGDIKVIEFNIAGNITACANFSQAIIATRCTSDTFTGTPRGC